MDTEGFVRWALDDARTVEERYTVELLVEDLVRHWHSKNQTGKHERWELQHERDRQRFLNPAYEPVYSEESLRRAAEIIPEKTYWHHYHFEHRPIRDLKAFRFLTALEHLVLNVEATDLSPLLDLPRLRILSFSSLVCEDYRPLARCASLRELTLNPHYNIHRAPVNWPDVSGLENLTQLECLHLTGNLLAFKPGIAWPNVRRGTLHCAPLAARNVRDLPQFPACEFLTLEGVDRLDGIQQFPRLRNLTLTGRVRDFAPLEALRELTWFTCNAAEPLDVSPLTRIPKLHYLAFKSHHNYTIDKAKPRDFSPLAEAPNLRELHVEGCPPVDTEVAGLNAGLTPCDDLYLLPNARPVPPSLKIILAEKPERLRGGIHRAPDEPELIDDGLRECENKWVERFVARTLSRRLGSADWGKINGSATNRSFIVWIESFGVVEKLPEILDGVRETLSRLRHDYQAAIFIALKAPKLESTPAHRQLEKQFQDEQNEAEHERRQQEHREYLERLHRFELKKQEGSAVKPEEFAAPAPLPLPPPPWERDEDEEDDSDTGSSDVAVKKKPDPPPSWGDDEHPLAENYSLMGWVTLTEARFEKRDHALVAYLMRRQPDVIVPDEEKK